LFLQLTPAEIIGFLRSQMGVHTSDDWMAEPSKRLFSHIKVRESRTSQYRSSRDTMCSV